MSKKTLTRDEQFLAKAAGDDVPMPKPLTRVQEFLERIVERLSGSVTEETLSNAIAPLNASIARLSRKTIQFRHGKGMFTATATGTNVVWQYGGQKAQGSNCTFDVKSDNGLIVLKCDSINSFTIEKNTAIKIDLSDLDGKITNVLNLYSCPNITGDLSDLGGRISNLLNLSNCSNITGNLSGLIRENIRALGLDNCSNITGDLSDLGGRVLNFLSLNGCTNITGVYSGAKYPKTFAVSKTAITSADMDANLINFAASGVKSGKFTANGMKRTAASDDAVATLVTNGWTVSGLTKEG